MVNDEGEAEGGGRELKGEGREMTNDEGEA